MKKIKFTTLFLLATGISTSAFAHDYVESCKNMQVPIYDTNAADDALAGAVIGGVLGKVVTKKDQGAAAGALIGGIIGAEQSKKKIVGYKNERKCENIRLDPHAHKQTNWNNPDNGSININNSVKSETKEEIRIRKRVEMSQVALNYFGFNVGKADGISGRRTKDGIKSYQDFIGIEPTGELSISDLKVLVDCEESSKASGETALADRLKTLQYCATLEYSSKSASDDLSQLKNENIMDDQQQITYLGLVRENHMNSKNNVSLNQKRVEALNSRIKSYNYKGPLIDLPKDVNIDYFMKTPFELDYIKSVNPTTGQTVSDKFVVNPIIDSSNNLYYNLNFLELNGDWSVVSMRVDGIDIDESKKLVEAINTASNWNDETKKRKIRQNISKFLDCIPDCSNKVNVNIYNTLSFEVTKSGDTYLKIQQSESDFVLMEMETAIVLSAYIDYLNKVHKFSSESNLSDKEIDSIFK